MILEGLVTTLDADGRLNVAPMGPRVDAGFWTFALRPFRPSRTYANLLRHGEGVLHVTDDVTLYSRPRAPCRPGRRRPDPPRVGREGARTDRLLSLL